MSRWVALSLAALSGACEGIGGDGDPARCAQCGMRVDLAPEFRAGAVAADGRGVAFDAPKCLFRWLASDRGRGARDPWAVEWYGQSRRPIEALHFVVGSDVIGPMGHDLVPVLGAEAAARFREDHAGGGVVRATDVDRALLEGLDAPRR